MKLLFQAIDEHGVVRGRDIGQRAFHLDGPVTSHAERLRRAFLKRRARKPKDSGQHFTLCIDDDNRATIFVRVCKQSRARRVLEEKLAAKNEMSDGLTSMMVIDRFGVVMDD